MFSTRGNLPIMRAMFARREIRFRTMVGILLPLVLGVACGDGEGPPPATMTPGWTLDELSAQQGFQFRLPDFDVPSGHEEQSCYFLRVPDLADGEDFWIDRIKMATSVGSHHLNIFRVRTIVGLDPAAGAPIQIGPYDGTVIYGHDDYRHSPCWASANWADWPLVANTQSPLAQGPYTDWQLPTDVAIRFTPGEWLMVQPHYVNGSAQPTQAGARVGINFYRSRNPAPTEMGTLFATQQSIRICRSRPRPQFSGVCRVPSAVTVTAANGHFHSRGRQFSMFVWDGHSTDQPPATDQFYDSAAWDNPPMETGIDRAVPADGGIWWNCSYQWREPANGCAEVDAKDPDQAGDCCYVFGGNTDVGEHCNAFVYYYPKLATDVFCN
jgi:hypothetical protein